MTDTLQFFILRNGPKPTTTCMLWLHKWVTSWQRVLIKEYLERNFRIVNQATHGWGMLYDQLQNSWCGKL